MAFDDLLQWLQHQTISVQKLIGGTIQAISITLASGGTIESSNFVTGVSGWQITGAGVAEFQSATIRGTLNADDITVGTLDAARIAANTLEFQHLVLMSPDNLIQDPGFELAASFATSIHSQAPAGTTQTIQSTTVRGTSGQAIEVNQDGTMTGNASINLNGASSSPERHPSAAEDDEFSFEFYHRNTGTTDDVRGQIRFIDETGGTVSTVDGAWVSPTTSWTRYTMESGAAPANTKGVMFRLQTQQGTGTGSNFYDDVTARRKIKTINVEDAAIELRKLVISSFDNLVQDPSFESGLAAGDQVHSYNSAGGTFTNQSTTVRSGGWAIEYDQTGQTADASYRANGDADINRHPACVEGDEFSFTFWYRRGAAATDRIRGEFRWFDETNTQVGAIEVGSWATPTTSWQKYTYDGVQATPAGAVYIQFRILFEDGASTGLFYIDDVTARRRIETDNIEDLAVDTAQLNTNAATAPKINDYDPADANTGTFSGQTFRAVDSNGFGFSSATTSGVKIDSSNVILQRAGATRIIGFSTAVRSGDQFDPQTNNIGGLGQSGLEWTDVWATDTSINTSDPSLKSELSASSLGLGFIRRLEAKKWKWTEIFDRAKYEQIMVEEYEPLAAQYEQKVLETEAAEYSERVAAKSGRKDDHGSAALRAEAENLKSQMEAKRTRALAARRTGSRYHHGLDASNVKQAMDDEGVTTQEFGGYIQDAKTGLQHLRLGEFTAPIINAIQELADRMDAAGI